ncbi:MAG TPA: prepilin-type N-terminal cleavage/methylation domain-containing protein [Acidobacteriota bacterium]|nr:prepilin-type N-terminal cleavage/methylation domain-containing protein [Acidobacteriota bacterium]
MNRTRGFSLIELMIVVAVISIIIAMAIPNLVQSRIAANEASALSSVRSITSAQLVYSATETQGNFAASLADLNAIQLIDGALAAGEKDGYAFTTAGGPGGFTVSASPVSESTGRRYFFSDETAVIRFSVGGPADASSTPMGNSGIAIGSNSVVALSTAR